MNEWAGLAAAAHTTVPLVLLHGLFCCAACSVLCSRTSSSGLSQCRAEQNMPEHAVHYPRLLQLTRLRLNKTYPTRRLCNDRKEPGPLIKNLSCCVVGSHARAKLWRSTSCRSVCPGGSSRALLLQYHPHSSARLKGEGEGDHARHAVFLRPTGPLRRTRWPGACRKKDLHMPSPSPFLDISSLQVASKPSSVFGQKR